MRTLTRTDLPAARALLAAACRFDRAAEVADEVLFGPALGYPAQANRGLAVAEGEALHGLVVTSGAWIRMLAVHPKQRQRGLGSALLGAAERAIAQAGADTVRVLDQPGNYLAPGVDVRNRETVAWLVRRGYVPGPERVNLVVDVATNPQVTPAGLRSFLLDRLPGYDIRRARGADRAALTAWIEAEFSPGWAFEVESALALEPPGVHIAIARSSGEIAAFSAHDGNNRGLGWFGPAGTRPAQRGRGLGRALLWAALLDIAQAGHAHCEVAWIGPRGFYQRAVGVVGERRFVPFTKDMS